MKVLTRKTGSAVFLTLGLAALPCVGAETDQQVTADEVVQHCNYRYPGEDQKARMTIIKRDKSGDEKKEVYERLWKDYKGKDNIVEKMVMFTEYPPDSQGAGFLRVAYLPNSDKIEDQWIYLPSLKKMRRVSVRDPGDAFLGTDLTYADISGRQIDADEHSIVKTLKRGTNEVIIAVQSVPKDKSHALYGKIVSWYAKEGDNWDSCHKEQMDYFDLQGEPLKQETITWQRVGDAWLWNEVKVQNVRTGHSSTFQVTDAKVNVGLPDSTFSERNLSRGQ
jgi:hypothetical protein